MWSQQRVAVCSLIHLCIAVILNVFSGEIQLKIITRGGNKGTCCLQVIQTTECQK